MLCWLIDMSSGVGRGETALGGLGDVRGLHRHHLSRLIDSLHQWSRAKTYMGEMYGNIYVRNIWEHIWGNIYGRCQRSSLSSLIQVNRIKYIAIIFMALIYIQWTRAWSKCFCRWFMWQEGNTLPLFVNPIFSHILNM